MSQNQDEEATVRAFFSRHRRERMRRRGREDELLRLWQYDDSDLRYAHVVAGADRFPDKLYPLLKAKGAPETCYLMGTTSYDGQYMDLREALRIHLMEEESFCDVIISCVPGRLAYLHTHEPYLDDYLLERPGEQPT